MRIERCHVVVYGIFRQEFVGIREEIALALHKTAGGFLVVRDILPEFVRAEITGIGFFQKLLGGAQASRFHPLCDVDGGDPLREGQADALGLGVFGKGCDDFIVGAAGLQRKFAVLELCRRALAAHVPAEELREADDPRLLQFLGNGAHAAALRDLDRYGLFLLRAAVDLPLCQQEGSARRQYQQHQNDQQDLQRTALFAGLRMIAFRHPSIPFSPASAAYSSRSRQRARPQSGSCRNPAGCPRRGRGSARPPR